MFFFGSMRIYNKIYGYNNVKSSKISSKKINISKYIYDTNELSDFLKKKIHEYKVFYFSYSKFFLDNFYSILFRNKKCDISFIDIIKFHVIFIKKVFFLKKIIIALLVLKNITKIYLKKIYIFFK